MARIKKVLRNRVAELIAIKARREGLGRLSNRQVALDAKLPKLTVDLYVKNEVTRYDASTLEAFAEYFGCEIEDLLVFEEVEPRDMDSPKLKTPLPAA